MNDKEQNLEFLREVKSFPIASHFLDFWSKNYPKGEFFKIDTSSVIQALSWNDDTLYIKFMSNAEYMYYDVPFDLFAMGCFSEWLNDMRASDEFDSTSIDDLPKTSLGDWFNEMIKGVYEYTRWS